MMRELKVSPQPSGAGSPYEREHGRKQRSSVSGGGSVSGWDRRGVTVLYTTRPLPRTKRFSLGRVIVAGLLLEAAVTGAAFTVYVVLGRVWP